MDGGWPPGWMLDAGQGPHPGHTSTHIDAQVDCCRVSVGFYKLQPPPRVSLLLLLLLLLLFMSSSSLSQESR